MKLLVIFLCLTSFAIVSYADEDESTTFVPTDTTEIPEEDSQPEMPRGPIKLHVHSSNPDNQQIPKFWTYPMPWQQKEPILLNLPSYLSIEPSYWSLDAGSSNSSNTEPDIESLLLDGTTIKPKLINGEWASVHCRCNSRNAFKKIEGESYDRATLAVVEKSCGKTVAGNLGNRAMLAYNNIDFGSKKDAKALVLHMSNGSPKTDIPSQVLVYIDNPIGKPIAKFYTNSNGNWCDYFSLKVHLDVIPTGIRDLYLVFEADPSNKKVKVMNLDWLAFTSNLELSSCKNYY